MNNHLQKKEREINRAIAEKVFRLKLRRMTINSTNGLNEEMDMFDKGDGKCHKIPSYCTDMNSAMILVERYHVMLIPQIGFDEEKKYCAVIQKQTHYEQFHQHAPMAICLVVLQYLKDKP